MDTNALHNPPPIPISEGLLSRNSTIMHPPNSINIMQHVKTVTPMGPVLTQIKTYSESGGISERSLYLFQEGMFSVNIPMPIPQGASFMYLAIDALLISRTFADLSLLSKADLILRICWLPSPIFVKIKMNAKKTKAMENGTAILTDFDNITYTINPAAKQKMAVLVPDWNIPHMTNMDTMR